MFSNFSRRRKNCIFSFFPYDLEISETFKNTARNATIRLQNVPSKKYVFLEFVRILQDPESGLVNDLRWCCVSVPCVLTVRGGMRFVFLQSDRKWCHIVAVWVTIHFRFVIKQIKRCTTIMCARDGYSLEPWSILAPAEREKSRACEYTTV